MYEYVVPVTVYQNDLGGKLLNFKYLSNRKGSAAIQQGCAK